MLHSSQPDIKTLLIREAHPGDVLIMNRLFPKGVPEIHIERVKKQLERKALYLIAVIHEKPVGHALLLWDGIPAEEVRMSVKNCPAIEDLLVDRLYRSRGIGTRLLDECAKRVREKGFHQMGLAVGITNIQAKQLYLRSGFLDSGISDFWVEWPYIDTVTGERKKEGEMCRFLIKHL